MKRGLVIGKFCPLHKGHQLLIEMALAETEELHIWSWSQPEFPEFPPALREHWLRNLYPTAKTIIFTPQNLQKLCPELELPLNNAADDVHQQFVARLWDRLIRQPLHSVHTSELYGEPLVSTLNRMLRQEETVVHRPVNLPRDRMPVSGRQLRSRWSPELLHPFVAETTERRVVFLGAESTGKTILSEWAAHELGGVVIPEYGRALWEQKSGALELADMLAIATKQVAPSNVRRPGARDRMITISAKFR